MKRKLTAVFALALAFAAGAVVSAQARDWHDLDAIHNHVIESIHEMERARAANHYDMDGHGIKAEALLHQAEHELDLAVRSARAH
jgi:NAD-dependent DNA ligase